MASRLNLRLCCTLSSCLSTRWATPRLPLILRPRSFSTSQLRNADAPEHERTPFVNLSEVERSRVGNSSLTINGKLRHFQNEGHYFSEVLEEGQAYFDRTRYISVLNGFRKALLFFRPRRFGKSLTVSMLEHFHGLQYADRHQSCYQGLDVQKDIKEGRVTPGQFFVLKFDFSVTQRSSNFTEAGHFLENRIARSLQTFLKTYSTYLGEDADKLSRDITPERFVDNLEDCVELVREVLSNGRNEQLASVRGIYLLVDECDAVTNNLGSAVEQVFTSFWSTIKSLLPVPNGIQKAFITGVAPLSLAGLSSAFNMTRNLSSHASVAGLCGLTRVDIEAALEKLCGSDTDAYKKHLQDMTTYLNGYHFCNQKTLETIYNTETCLAYLQCLMEGSRPEAQDPVNSEVSQQFLRKFSTSPAAIADFETGLRRDKGGDFVPFKYDRLKQDFTLGDLDRDIECSQPAWRSLMLCCGGLTFDQKDPAHYLKIPNLIAAERIAEVVLEKYELRETLDSALECLQIDGDVRPVLRCYRKLMVQRDVHENDFRKSEETHRDSFYFSLVKNPSLRPQVEFQLTKPNKTDRADIVLRVGNHLIVMEWKVVPIDFLDIPIPRQRSKKATGATEPSHEPIMRNKLAKKVSVLSTYSLNKVLGINFGKNDKFRVGKLKEWIIDSVAPHLKSQIMSEEVQKELEGGLSLKAQIVIIIGSRQILVWDMDADGKLVGEPDLVW